jgi:hypothetical protein
MRHTKAESSLRLDPKIVPAWYTNPIRSSVTAFDSAFVTTRKRVIAMVADGG